MSVQVTVALSGEANILSSFTVDTPGSDGIRNEVIVASATTSYNFNIPVLSALKLLMVVASIDCAMIINTDVPGSADYISLYANTPFLWWRGIGATIAQVLGASPITKFLIHNYSTTAGVLNIFAKQDPTP